MNDAGELSCTKVYTQLDLCCMHTVEARLLDRCVVLAHL